MHRFWHSDAVSIPLPSSPRGEDFDAQVDAVMRATKLLVAITAHAMADLEAVVTLPQFRVLVMASADRALNRLVAAGLLDRREDPDDRRQIVLSLTEAGRRLIDSVMERRRIAIGDVLAEMSPDRRISLADDLNAFSTAAERLHDTGEPPAGWVS
jgi:hypothetical protein